MKYLYFFVFLFSFAACAAENCEHRPDQFSCVKYLTNYDGDTITFNLPNIHPFFGKKAKLRVEGIDTPELKPKGLAQPCETEWARVAKKLVQNELKFAKRIDITNLSGRDKYGRILGQVVYDGKNIKDVLVKNHLAVPYEGKTKSKVNWCDLQKKRGQQNAI